LTKKVTKVRVIFGVAKGGKVEKNLATPNLRFVITGVARVARVANNILEEKNKYIFSYKNVVCHPCHPCHPSYSKE
jgi:hypothetical protein